MKKILITGAGSFVGTSFAKYLESYPEDYNVDTLDMLGGEWRDTDFSGYDSIFHVAGIAHSDSGKISREREALYYSVNTDLAVSVATKAKSEGVGQFIYMSSSIVYGQSSAIGKTKHITSDTIPTPANCYGDSKLKAEKGLFELESDSFKVVALRPPMIYGKGCKGNFAALSKIARHMPIFPNIKNERSVLYIDNLSEFVRLMIDNYESGVFFPQNREYMNTSYAIKALGKVQGKRICLVRGLKLPLRVLSVMCGAVNKAFGSFTYDKALSEYKYDYCKKSFDESILEMYGDN